MYTRAVWDLQGELRVVRSVRSLRACRPATTPSAAPPPSPQPSPPQPFQALDPAQAPVRARESDITDAQMVHALWYAVRLDMDVHQRVVQLLERARRELGYAPAN